MSVAVFLTFFCVGCGPSVQSIYEGKVRFEHCYRLDLDERITRGHREACWNQWVGTYSYGQPRDRMEYARRRVHSLEMGDPDRPRLNLDDSKRPTQRQFYLSVPAPTSAHSPPPPIATRVYQTLDSPPEQGGAEKGKEAAAGNGTKATPDEAAPGDACISTCRSSRKNCLASVCAQTPASEAQRHSNHRAPQPGSPPETHACDCDSDYRACITNCMK